MRRVLFLVFSVMLILSCLQVGLCLGQTEENETAVEQPIPRTLEGAKELFEKVSIPNWFSVSTGEVRARPVSPPPADGHRSLGLPAVHVRGDPRERRRLPWEVGDKRSAGQEVLTRQ